MAEIVEPVVEFKSGSFSCRSKPQERWDYRRECFDPNAAIKAGNVFACKDEDDAGLVTLDRTLRVRVRELLYPGNKSEAIVDKWIYIIFGGSYFAEIHAIEAGKWEYLLSPNPEQENDARKLKAKTTGHIPLDPGPKGSENKYKFFLSPFRLTPAAMKFLLRSTQSSDLDATIEETFPQAGEGLVETPDPFRWAMDAHDKFYLPAVAKWNEWRLEEERQAKLFVAGVLESWIANGDKMDVEDEIDTGKMRAFVSDYKNKEQEYRKKAEQAAAYLAHCVDSLEHITVERAAMDLGGESMSAALIHWSVVTSYIVLVEPGRRLAAHLAENASRIPKKYIFADAPPDRPFAFGDFRYGWIASINIFENIVPAVFARLRHQQVPDQITRIRQYLEGIGVKDLVGRQKTIFRNVKTAKEIGDLSKGFGQSAGAQRKFAILIQELDEKSLEQALQKVGTAKVEKLHAEYAPVAKGLTVTVGTVLEVINFSNALSAWMDNKYAMDMSAVSVLGATADLSAHLASLGSEVAEHAAKKGLAGGLKSFAAGASVVSGICDMVAFEEAAVNAAMVKNDYGQTVGNAISMVGAGTVAVGGAMVLAAQLSGTLFTSVAWGGPYGVVVGAIGAVLIFAGCAVAIYFADNPYEKFARHCIWGDDYGDVTRDAAWALGGMGPGDAKHNAKHLIALLSQFQVRGYSGVGSGSTEGFWIQPGYVTEASVFEIEIESYPSAHRTFGPKTARFKVKVDLGSDSVTQVAGDFPLYPGSIYRDANGRVENISISATFRHDTLTGFATYPRMWIRLHLYGKGPEWTPPGMDWLEVDWNSKVSSLDTSLWRGQPVRKGD
ncbi:MAG: hypothetical protein SFV54_07150 [Bryobacteraceae bacterium]|nr:hypothetical protein [Bryobacteraceae bacterium]